MFQGLFTEKNPLHIVQKSVHNFSDTSVGGGAGVFTESVTVHDYQHNPSITAKFCRNDDLEAGGSIKPVGPPVMADETLIRDV